MELKVGDKKQWRTLQGFEALIHTFRSLSHVFRLAVVAAAIIIVFITFYHACTNQQVSKSLSAKTHIRETKTCASDALRTSRKV